MNYVLSVVRPPEGGAAHGKATVYEPLPERKNLHLLAYRALREANPSMDMDMASRYAWQIVRKDIGFVAVESSTGLRFRIDDADTPPNVCPCCGLLVAPEDAMFAGDPKTECAGCYPWHRTDAKCQPQNTAHPTEETG
jgi:hypothetical protein